MLMPDEINKTQSKYENKFRSTLFNFTQLSVLELMSLANATHLSVRFVRDPFTSRLYAQTRHSFIYSPNV